MKFSKNHLYTCLTVISLWLGLLLPTSHAASLVYDTVDNVLYGAEYVNVIDKWYNVAFMDASIESQYKNSNNEYDMPFATWAEALAASEALLAQVFLDDTYPLDTDPSLTNGIDHTAANIITPYNRIEEVNGGAFSLIFAAWANNTANEAWDKVAPFEEYYTTNYDTFTNVSFTLAVWEEVAAPVPEPATVLLFGLGLLGLAGVSRKKQ